MTYTTNLSSQVYNILDAEDFTSELKKAAELFRTFDTALDTFIAEHGYTGDMDSAEEKVRFISDKCKAAGVPIPRNIKRWYSEHIRIKRETAFQICFAFELTIEEVFGYNNATAYEAIQCIWQELSGERGIVVRERKKLYMEFDKDKEDPIIPPEPEDVEPGDRKRMETSVWEIYLTILGLAGNMVADLYEGRSLKTVLKDNALLHPLAEDMFPDRGGIETILNGKHTSYERVRKILILLVFYRFWAKRALKVNNYVAEYRDADRCISAINDNLFSAGYAALYPGNPYDFIILTSVNADCPLMTFREYMREIYIEYERTKTTTTEYRA